MGNCCSDDYRIKEKDGARHMIRDRDDEGQIVVFDDPHSQSRVLVVDKGPGHQKEMYLSKEDHSFNTQTSPPQNGRR